MHISIEITMNMLATDRWTIYRRKSVTAKVEKIRLIFTEPVNAMQLTGSLQTWQGSDDKRFNRYVIFKCLPTAEEPKKKAAPKRKVRRVKLPRQWVYMFKMRFVPRVLDERKLRTMRPKRKDGKRPKPGDRISLRYWRGKAYWSQHDIIRESIVRAVSSVVMEQGKLPLVDGKVLTRGEAEAFALYDGFEDYTDMQEWFEHEHGQRVELDMIEWFPKSHQPANPT